MFKSTASLGLKLRFETRRPFHFTRLVVTPSKKHIFVFILNRRYSLKYYSPTIEEFNSFFVVSGCELPDFGFSLQERKIMDVGPANWQKACFVPTKADALVVGFRRWLKKYAGGQFNWGRKFNATLPPTPPREQLMDRYLGFTL